jgi:arylsulfatase A-like enzyme
MLRLNSITSAALCAPLLCLASCGAEPGTRIVLITLDTLRYDAYVDQMERTREWAQDAAVFERYYSATSTTQPTHATLFTGLHPWQTGVPFNGALLAPEHETVAEQLQRAGFTTAAVVASFPVHHQFGFDQGFDVFDDEFTEGQVDQWSGHQVTEEHFHSDANHITQRARELLDAAEGARQFFWFHYYDPHAPYGGSGKGGQTLNPRSIVEAIKDGAPKEEVLSTARTAYDKDVRFLDRSLGRLFERLAEDADRIETHVVIVSDHGESFGESASLGHGKRLTPEQVHVPLIVHSPRVEPGPRPEPVGTIDVTATLLSLGGITDLPATARVLTEPFDADLPVFGMRRTFNERYREARIDGSVQVIEPDDRRFFIVEKGALYTGNSGEVMLDDSQAVSDPALIERYQGLFGDFEEKFNAVGFDRMDDADTINALKELGYAE